jgi:putative ABC transport system permease protein
VFKQLIKVAFQHLWRNRLYSLVNITGLTLGMTCSIFAILYVRDEMNYDRFNAKAGQLYRLATTIKNPQDGTPELVATTGQVQGPAFKNGIPEILDFVRIFGEKGINLSSSTKSIGVNALYVDTSFFNLFSFPLIKGNSSSILNEPYSLVLSASTAIKFFGTTNVIGQTLKLEEGHGIENLTITGVAQDPPSQSSIQFDILIPFSYLQLMFPDENWLNRYLTTFLLLNPLAKPKIVEQKFASIFELNAGPQLKQSGMDPGQFKFKLLPLTSIHLNPLVPNADGAENVEAGVADGSSVTYSYLLMGIVSFILLMACVNFINLNIAGSLKRAKEIAIRKVSGSSRQRIISQFLGEAFLLFLISFLLALLFCQILMPIFNHLANKKIPFTPLTDPGLLFYGILLMLISVLVAAVYPAVVLSLFNPAEVLYGKQKYSGRNIFGKSLIVLQFTLAVALIIASITYYRQMKFISARELGYNPADIIKIHLPPQRVNKKMIDLFRNELLIDPSFKELTSTMDYGNYSVNTESGRGLRADILHVDEYYLSTFEIVLKEGRNFLPPQGREETNEAIVNETFAKASGWENPIGQRVFLPEERTQFIVAGVVKDYQFGSAREKIEPQLLAIGKCEYIFIKIQKGKTTPALSTIEKIYDKIIPEHYYQFEFLDTENANVYHNDQKWQQIIAVTTAIAILICCIGLFGMVYFAVLKRNKEMAVRKVLGASVINIARLLVKDFLLLVSIGIVIASPIAWYAMQNWLQGFAYRIEMGWWIFVLAGLIALSIALITVSFQSLKAAVSEPMNALRNE